MANEQKEGQKVSLQRATTSKYFGERFTEALNRWTKDTGKTQKDFADLLGVSANTISSYKKGKIYPRDYVLNMILKEFGVTKEYFIPQTHGDLYRDSPEFVAGIVAQKRDFMKQIGLDEGFLQFVHDCTGFDDTDDGYPQWLPLYYDFINSKYYYPSPADSRVEASSSRDKVEDGKVGFEDGQFLTSENGKTHILHENDLRVLKDIQDEVAEFIRFKYHERRRQMQKNLETANRMSISKDENGATSYSILTHEQIVDIDKYSEYLPDATTKVGSMVINQKKENVIGTFGRFVKVVSGKKGDE